MTVVPLVTLVPPSADAVPTSALQLVDPLAGTPVGKVRSAARFVAAPSERAQLPQPARARPQSGARRLYRATAGLRACGWPSRSREPLRPRL